MPPNANADVVWVDVLPSMANFGREFARGTNSAARDAGTSSGREFGRSFGSSAADEVEAQSERVNAAMRKSADAAGQVRIATERLNEVRAKGNATASQLARAEEALAKAKRNAEAASEALSASTQRLVRAQEQVAASSRTAGTALAGFGQQMDDNSKKADNNSSVLRGLTAGMNALWSVTKLSFTSTGLVGLGGALVAIAGAASQAGGALLLVPGIAAAAAPPVAALALGLMGMEEAFAALAEGDPEKLAEAMAKLAPSAREVVSAVDLLRPAFEGLRLEVQQQLFEGLAGTVTALGETYLPLAEERLRRFAAVIGAEGQRIGSFLVLPETKRDVSTILSASEAAFRLVVQAAQPFLEIFLDIATVGADYLPRFGEWLLNVATRFRDMVQAARDSGQINQWIDQGLNMLRQFGGILGDIGGLLGAVFGAGSESGETFISTLGTAVSRLRDFASSPPGAQALEGFFGSVKSAVTSTDEVFVAVATTMGTVVAPALADFAETLAPVAGTLVYALRDALIQLLPAVVPLATAIGNVVTAILPLIPPIATLVAVLLVPLANLLAAVSGPLAQVAVSAGVFYGVLRAGLAINALYVAAMQAYAFYTYSAAASTGVLTAAMHALKTAFLTNPFTIVLAALAALAVGFYLAWQNSETFRNIVTGALEWVGDRAQWVWQNALKPAFDALVVAWNAVADAAVWAWNNVLKPTFDALGAAGMWLWNNALRPAFEAITAAWSALATGIMWAWTNVVQPAWNAVSAAAGVLWSVLGAIFSAVGAAWSALTTGIMWAWENVLRPTWNFLTAAAEVLKQILLVVIFGPIVLAWLALTTAIEAAWNNVLRPAWQAVSDFALFMWNSVLMPTWNAMRAGWDALLTAFRWAWENILRPTWDALSAAARFLWDNVLTPIWNAMRAGWDALLTAFRWAWDNILRPTYNAIETAINWLWNNVARPVWSAMQAAWDVLARAIRFVYDTIIQPAFDAVSGAVDRVRQAFQSAVDWIGSIWNGLKRLLAVPINFMIGTVWNNGIRKVWNLVAAILPGVDEIGEAALIPENAAGGPTERGTSYERGGKVRGPWMGPTADNVLALVGGRAPIRVNPREWIHPVDAVDDYGNRFMADVQQRQFPRELVDAYYSGTLAHYASGGQLFAEVLRNFPRAKSNSQFRAGDPGYHGRDQAVDLGEQGFAGGNGRPYLADMSRWLTDNYGRSREIIYNGTGDDRMNVKNGAGFAYSAAVQAQHRNHVHWAHDGTLASARNSGLAGLGNFIQDTAGSVVDVVQGLLDSIVTMFATPARAIVNAIPFDAPPAFMGIPKKAGNAIIDKAVDFFNADANAQVGTGDAAATPGGAGAGARTSSYGGVLASVKAVGDEVQNVFGGMTVGGFAARNIAGTNTVSDHALGKALDFMTYTDMAKGQQIANYLVANAGRLRSDNVIWNRRIWSGSGWGAYNGASPHTDHVHWDTFWKGGQIGLPEFHQGGHTRRWRREAPAMLAPDERVFTPAQDTYFRRFVEATSGHGHAGGDRRLADKIEVHANDRDQGIDIVNKLWHKVRVADRGGVHTFTV